MKNPRIYGDAPYKIAVLHGGPGAPGEVAPVARELSTIYGTLEPIQTSNSIDGLIRELHTIFTNHAEFPITLVGHSWGSILGTLVVSSYPELIQAYAGIGQVVNILQNEKLSYQYTIDQAKERGNEKALKQLKKLEPYPEKDISETKALRKQRKWLKIN